MRILKQTLVVAVLALWTALPAPSSAQMRPAPDTSAIDAAWRTWMTQHGIVKSSIAIGYDGRVLHSAGVKRDPQTAYPMASLSKSVTALCLTGLLEQSGHSWSSTLSDLSRAFAELNMTVAPELKDITLSQLATHTSGFPKKLDYGKNSISKRNLSSQSTMARAALKVPANFGKRGTYSYSNANYAILGVLINALSGKPYGDYCAAQIMSPAGATKASVTGRMASTAGYGGWSVSVEDYAKYAMHWFHADQPWVSSPQDYAYSSRSGYGLGISSSKTAHGRVLHHYGKWTHTTPRMPNIGSMVLTQPGGATIVINWDRSLDNTLYRDLYQRLTALM